MRKVSNKTDGVGDEDARLGLRLQRPNGRIKRSEKLIGDKNVARRECSHERRLTGIGVTDDSNFGQTFPVTTTLDLICVNGFEFSLKFTQIKSSVVVTGKVCPKLLSSVTPMPVSLLSCEHSRRATFLSPINFSLRLIRPFGRCSRRPNLASSSPTPSVLFETFRMISWPHFDRLSTKRWMLRSYFM